MSKLDVWESLKHEISSIVSKIEGTLVNSENGERSRAMENTKNLDMVAGEENSVQAEWIDFGVPEGDGCRRLEPPLESDKNGSEEVEKNPGAEEALPHHVTDLEHRFALMQRIIDRLIVTKLYADRISIDYMLVNAMSLSTDLF